MSRQLKYLNENITLTVEDTKQNIEDIRTVTKKVDGLAVKIQGMRNFHAEASTQRTQYIDTTKFLEINSFSEYAKMNNKDMLAVNFRVEEFKRTIDDIELILKEKITMAELKKLEGII